MVKSLYALNIHSEKIKDSDTKIEAILMGTRIDDPHGKYVSDFSPTDVQKGLITCLNKLLLDLLMMI